MKRPSIALRAAGFVAALSLTASLSAANLQITPSTFDFGWSPENAKISAEFVIKNTSPGAIPVTGVQPACGCTAADFSPTSLSSQEQKPVLLTFNTRGYNGLEFYKSAKVTSENPPADQTVFLKGHVTDPNATVAPTGDGVASFEPSENVFKKAVTIENKSADPVTLDVVQKPASWANVKLPAKTLAPGAKMDLAVSVDGSLLDARFTSATFEAKAAKTASRFTIAIRTGEIPAFLKHKTPAPSVAPTAAPKP